SYALLECFDRLVVTACPQEGHTERSGTCSGQWIGLDELPALGCRFIKASKGIKKEDVELMRSPGFGSQIKGSTDFVLCVTPPEFVPHISCSKDHVPLRQRIVDANSLSRGRHPLRATFGHRKKPVSSAPVIPGQTCIGSRVVWIERNGLIEVVSRVFESARRQLVRFVHTLEIKIVGFRILGAALHQARSLVFGQPQTQRRRNLSRDVPLYCEYIGAFSIVLLTPEPAVVLDVDELCSDQEVISMQCDPSGQHSTHTELAPGSSNIRRRSSVTRHRAAGHDAEVRQLRKT